MKSNQHTYFILINTTILALGIFAFQWPMSYILHFLFVYLQLEALVLFVKLYLNSNYATEQSVGNKIGRIAPVLSEWLLLVVSMLPPMMMLVVLAMAYLDEDIGEQLYSLSTYFSNTFYKLFSATFYLAGALILSFLIEHLLHFFRGTYKTFDIRRYVRAMLFNYLLVFPTMVLGILMLHEVEDIDKYDAGGLIFPSMILLAKIITDLLILNYGYLPVKPKKERKPKSKKRKKKGKGWWGRKKVVDSVPDPEPSPSPDTAKDSAS